MSYPEPNATLSAKQFLPTLPTLGTTMSSKGDQLDMGWADRDLDPVLSSSSSLSPASTVSSIKPGVKPAGYAPTNFKT